MRGSWSSCRTRACATCAGWSSSATGRLWCARFCPRRAQARSLRWPRPPPLLVSIAGAPAPQPGSLVPRRLWVPSGPRPTSRGHASPSFSTHEAWSLLQAVPAVDVSSGLSDGSTELATSASAMDCESSSVVDQRPGSSRSDLDLEQCLAGTGEELQGAGLSPAFKSCGFVVRNTFIDAAPERQAGASRRCRSVPREMHFAMHE
mmetsp:Transcript_101433/g.284377  ORF Transcript_101433/g.284377 Transcript_101433/m.284377 type:complete len:204 (-) Transcript_101433:422-1033(-)